MNETVHVQGCPSGGACLFYLDRRRIVCTEKLQGRLDFSRNTADCTTKLRLESGYVGSRPHGEFFLNAGTYYFRDLGSTNGTYVNGSLLKDPNRAVALRDGDVLRIGVPGRDDPNNVVMIFSSSSDHCGIWNKFKPDSGLRSFSVGRQGGSPKDRIMITSPDVSRLHCVFGRTEGGWAIENKSATNPVRVNGVLIPRPVLLRPLDVIQIASGHIIFDGESFIIQARSSADPSRAAADQRPALKVSIVRRTVKVHGKAKDILRDISVGVPNGSFVLILGGSGAGKTTFMNAVMGYEPAEGRVLVDGIDIYKDYSQVKRLVGFVPQQNLVREKDLVFNTLMDAAQMKLSPAHSQDEIRRIVDRTLDLFGLTTQSDKLVSTLSGGQIRRLSIAIEYVGDPRLFFLDEPDSGLDYANTRVLLESLRNVADQGKIVMLISHSPDRGRDIYDKVLVLAKSAADGSGHLAFFGDPNQACDFFGVETLEEILVLVNSREEGGKGRADYYIDRFRRERQI